jgi:hypothetical protein
MHHLWYLALATYGHKIQIIAQHVDYKMAVTMDVSTYTYKG